MLKLYSYDLNSFFYHNPFINIHIKFTSDLYFSVNDFTKNISNRNKIGTKHISKIEYEVLM